MNRPARPDPQHGALPCHKLSLTLAQPDPIFELINKHRVLEAAVEKAEAE
jgi:hypothetical protein